MQQTPSTPRSPLPLAARRHPLVPHVRRMLKTRCAWDERAPLVLGVSGGADSLSLLVACAAIAPAKLTVAHVHHHLREQADADAEHVRAVCTRLGLPLVIEHVHPSRDEGNLAANARKLRYDALLRVAARANAPFVAVAHHADDQLETMLMALCRGAGLDGLSAMSWNRPLSPQVALIRPLLHMRRTDCEDLCSTAGLTWCEDAGNVDRAYARTRLRMDVLPVLECLWPGATQRAAAAADTVAAANSLVESKLQEVFGFPGERAWQRDALRALPVPLIAAGLRRAAIDALGRPSDDLGQRQLLPAAEGIADAQRRPREFGLGPSLVVRVTAREVVMQPR